MRERLFVKLRTIVMRIISKSFEVSARKITQKFFLISFILIEVGGNGFCNFVLEASSLSRLGGEGELATTSLEFEYLHRKS